MREHEVTFVDTSEIAETFNSEFTFDKVPIRKLLIAGIPKEATHKEIKKELARYGKIENCILKKRQNHGKSYAFVTYNSVEEARKARIGGHWREIIIKDQYLRVLPANSWNQPDSVSYQKEIDENPKELYDNDELENVFAGKCTIEDEEASIYKLNNDCLFEIFMYLSVYDRVKIERVCKRWQAVSRELWRSFKNLDFSHIKFWQLERDSYEPYKICGYKLKAPFLYHILRRSGDFITNIDFSAIDDFSNFGNSTIIMIGKLCPNVQSINFGNIEVETSGIKPLAQNCTNIKILRMQNLCTINSERLVDNTLSRLFARNKSLQCLQLKITSKCTLRMKCLCSLPYRSVNEIALECLHEEIIPHLSKSIQKLQFLRVLKLKLKFDRQIDCTALKTSIEKHAKTLTVLEISKLEFSYINVIPIAELKNLKELNVSENDFVDDELLMTLSATCKLLTNLNISGCRYVTNLGLASVASLPKLLHLDVSHLTNITDEVFYNMTTLKTLNCSYCLEVGNAGLINLIALANDLETLNLLECFLISNELFEAAAELTKHRINDKILTIIISDPYGDLGFAFNYGKESPFLNICDRY